MFRIPIKSETVYKKVSFYLTTMSLTLAFRGKEPVLSTYYYPPIELGYGKWELGLVNFQTFNSIPNVDKTNNLFHYDDDKVMEIPTGSYEITDIAEFLSRSLSDATIELTPNNN